ncbi:MAG TPA: glycosyltransferase family 39 protein [Tepidisphaeraceae bacterium]|jgi:hypothetical protein|nr:glycosyltransferase family 39 protein [Tepidisphaeraceae bacterium]
MTALPLEARLTDRLLLWVDRYRHFIFGAIALLYLAGYNAQWRVNSDSALYAAIARNLASGQGYSYLGQPDRIVEPGLPWTIALGFRLFGQDNFVLPTLVLLLAALGSLALVYRLFKLHVDRPTAVMMVLLAAVAERVYRYSFEMFTDMPFFLGVMLTLVGYEQIVRDRGDDDGDVDHNSGHAAVGYRSPIAWITIGLGLLIMNVFRATSLTFMGALALAIAWQVLRGPKRYRHLAIAGLAVAIVLALRLIDPRRQHVDQPLAREALLGSLLTDRLSWALSRTFFDFLPMLTGETAIEAILTFRIAPGINHLFCLGLAAIGLWLFRRRVLWGLWVMATLAQMLAWLPRERYFLPILPLLLFGLWSAIVWVNRRLDARRGNLVAAVALVLLTVPNLIQVVRYIAVQRRTPFYAHHNDGETQRTIDFARQMGSATRPDDLLVADNDRVLAYFSGRTVIASPFARRIPPSERELQAYRDRLAAAPRLLVLLPGDNAEEAVEALALQPREVIFEGDGLSLWQTIVPIVLPTTKMTD